MSPKAVIDPDLEKKAIDLVQQAGSKGILQSELWRHVNLNSREGSRVALRLEKQGLVNRNKELNDGRWTYRLYPIEEENSDPNDLHWDTLGDCPCFVCGSLSSCGARQLISPNKCDNLSEWIEKQVKIKGNAPGIKQKAESTNL